MKTIETTLRKEAQKLEKYLKEAQKRLENAPNGHLRVRQWKNEVEYYYYNADETDDNHKNNEAKIYNEIGENEKRRINTNGRYLRKSERNIAVKIAQRDYDMQLVKYAQGRLKAIEVFLKEYEKNSLKTLYQKINIGRRRIIKVSEVSDEEYIKEWQSVKYEGKDFAEYEAEIFTERGERVRSKSEKIIADKLYALGIPYRYECPIILEKTIKIYPDFTVLRMPMREEVYLEHLGMMNDISYVNNVIYKLNTYERNGIYLGLNLFLTYETGKKPLNTRTLNTFFKKLFLPE